LVLLLQLLLVSLQLLRLLLTLGLYTLVKLLDPDLVLLLSQLLLLLLQLLLLPVNLSLPNLVPVSVGAGKRRSSGQCKRNC
jgi:hypothetical protein